MEDVKDLKYEKLGDGWKTDPDIECCTKDPSETPPGCDCCYDTWKEELIVVKRNYNKANEEAIQANERYKFIVWQRDKFKAWLDDLIKTHQLSQDICNQFEVTISQTEKICTNSDKTVDAIEILFCMVRDLYEQVDLILTIYNQIDACIKCINSEELPENSGIRKCLKIYWEKLDAVIKTRNEVIKALMKAIRDANVLHESICSDFGLIAVITEWEDILNCKEQCNGGQPPEDPCKEQVKDHTQAVVECALIPVLTFPICNDSYYAWVKKHYEDDVKAANDLATELVAANKKKEALAACQNSLIAALKEVDPKELCK